MNKVKRNLYIRKHYKLHRTNIWGIQSFLPAAITIITW